MAFFTFFTVEIKEAFFGHLVKWISQRCRAFGKVCCESVNFFGAVRGGVNWECTSLRYCKKNYDKQGWPDDRTLWCATKGRLPIWGYCSHNNSFLNGLERFSLQLRALPFRSFCPIRCINHRWNTQHKTSWKSKQILPTPYYDPKQLWNCVTFSIPDNWNLVYLPGRQQVFSDCCLLDLVTNRGWVCEPLVSWVTYEPLFKSGWALDVSVITTEYNCILSEPKKNADWCQYSTLKTKNDTTN